MHNYWARTSSVALVYFSEKRCIKQNERLEKLLREKLHVKISLIVKNCDSLFCQQEEMKDQPCLEDRGRGEEDDGASVFARAALTPTNDHFCDYATGPRLLAANHKNDTGRCATSRDPLISIRNKKDTWKEKREVRR